MTLLSGLVEVIQQPTGPLWKGPEIDGVTSSLLSRYLCCKERFRLRVIDGWGPKDHFNNRIEFGNMWHKCEEAFASNQNSQLGISEASKIVTNYAADLCHKYPSSRQEIVHYYNICLSTFQEYHKYWAAHPDVKKRTPLLQESKFKVVYQLPSGRVVRLRGKWDSVDVIEGEVFLQENKTKSTIDTAGIGTQLLFDLQTMLYLVAMREQQGTGGGPLEETTPIAGVRYNVIKRSMHRLTPKDRGYPGFNSRLKGLIQEAPGDWFARWSVRVSAEDRNKFCQQCLNPVLENLCEDYDWWACTGVQTGDWNVWDFERRHGEFPDHCSRHFRMPYGIYNPTLEGQASDLDNLLNTGSTVGLQRLKTLFPELED